MPTDAGPAVLVGAVAQLYQGDLDFGRVAIERLAPGELGERVLVEDLSYGAVAVAQRLEELRPAVLVLVGAVSRGRPPGTLGSRLIEHPVQDAEDVRQAVAEAVTGYVGIDLVVEVGAGLRALPPRTVAVELEPVATAVSEHLSPEAEHAIEPALELVRAEVAYSSTPRL